MVKKWLNYLVLSNIYSIFANEKDLMLRAYCL